MMIVLLILMTATAMAAASLQTTQFELRGAGYNKDALQTQYVSEAAAVTTFAWIDATSLDRSFLNHLNSFSAKAPEMKWFGEPEVPLNNLSRANRTQWRQQQLLTNNAAAPITQPVAASADTLGTFGPRTPYWVGIEDKVAGATDYVVDLYDCRQLPNTVTPGSQVNQGGSGQLRQQQFYCVVTSRGRAFVPGAPSKKWQVKGADYVVNRFTMAHDARGTLVTPPILINL